MITFYGKKSFSYAMKLRQTLLFLLHKSPTLHHFTTSSKVPLDFEKQIFLDTGLKIYIMFLQEGLTSCEKKLSDTINKLGLLTFNVEKEYLLQLGRVTQ